jgi:glycosyltransferase involved in cell wall biosynthesis
MRVGVIYSIDVHNALYRAVFPADALRRRAGNETRLIRHDGRGKIEPRTLADCDVVHVYREADRAVIRCVDALRARGVGITWDNDDDIRLAPKESEFYRKVGAARVVREFQNQIHMMRRAHVVTTTTARLAERFAAECDRSIEVIPNYLADPQFVRGPRNGEGIVVGWVAGVEHIADARRLQITQVLQRVMERRPEVRVVTMGVRLDLDASRYKHHEYIPLHEIGAEVRKFDIGIAPLSDIPMSYARSDIKVKEYSAAGVPWLASKRGPYEPLNPKCGGLLVEDEGWEEALVDMVSSRWKRGQLRRCAERWARSQRIDKNIGRWEAVWQAAANAAKQSAAA